MRRLLGVLCGRQLQSCSLLAWCECLHLSSGSKAQYRPPVLPHATPPHSTGEDTIGLGVIGKEGSGRLRAVAMQQRQKLSAKAQKKVSRATEFGSSNALFPDSVPPVGV